MRTIIKKIKTIFNNFYHQSFSIIFILFFLTLHILYINTPFVNYEWAYRFGTIAIANQEHNLLRLFFNHQANPITYSLFSSLPFYIFGDQFASFRILSLLGGTILLVLLLPKKNPFLIMIVGLNPLIWIYTGRAYSEMLSVGIMMLALAYSRNGILNGIFATLASIVKYHSILVCVCYWGFRWIKNFQNRNYSSFLDQNFIAGIFTICGLFTFFLIYNNELGIWIIPEQYKKMFSLNFLQSINNFFNYGFYLGGMFFLTIPFHLRNTSWILQILVAIICLNLSLFTKNFGEMDFGSFNQLLGTEIILLIQTVGFWNFVLCCKEFWGNKKLRIYLITVIIYLALLSFTRPAQRYLIFVVPFWATMICLRLEINRLVKVCYVLILCGLNLFATMFQVQNASASSEIAEWSKNKNLKLNSGVIYPHVGVYSHHDQESKITVRLKPKTNEKILFSRVVKIFNFRLKEYFVVLPSKL